MEDQTLVARPRASDTWLVLLSRLLLGLVVASACVYVLVYLIIACFRVPYPFDLEWLESGMAHEVQRVLEGKPLYTEGNLEYIPFLYTPLYFYLAAPLAWLMGMDFTPLRLLSFIASLGCFGFLFLIGRRESRSWLGGVLAFGLYAATFRLGGAWFDTARVDSLLLFFMLAAFYLARFRTSRAAAWGTAILLSAAFLTKQSSLLFIAPVLLMMLVQNPRRGLLAGMVTAALLLGSTAILNYLNDGWYWYYFIEQTTKAGFEDHIWLGFWTQDLAAKLSIAIVFSVLGLAFLFASPGGATFWLYKLVTGGILLMCYASRLHAGGYDNVLMPIYAWIALLAGIGLVRLLEFARELPLRHTLSLQCALYLLCLAQFALLMYNPLKQVPTAADRKAGERLLDLIATTEGPVFMPYQNFLPALANKKVYASRIGIIGLLHDTELPASAKLVDELHRAIRERHFGLVIMNNDGYLARELLAAGYKKLPPLITAPGEFVPVTGVKTRPVAFYVRAGDKP